MVYLITGGARSGKSSYGQKLAKKLSDTPTYLATSNINDGEFEKRVNRHKSERDKNWFLEEIPITISKLKSNEKVILVDCVTLWLNNIFGKFKYDLDSSLAYAKAEFNKIDKLKTWIFISNEIGMGLHADSEIGRKFVDLHGWMNQHVAKNADEVVLMISGIPSIIKK